MPFTRLYAILFLCKIMNIGISLASDGLRNGTWICQEPLPRCMRSCSKALPLKDACVSGCEDWDYFRSVDPVCADMCSKYPDSPPWEDGRCFYTCPPDSPYIANDPRRGIPRCTESCASTPEQTYHYDAECVEPCPDELHFIKRKRCVASCPDTHLAVLSKDALNRDLVYCSTSNGSCPSDRKYESGGECVEACPQGQYILNRTICVKHCPDYSKWIVNGKCSESCPTFYAPTNEGFECMRVPIRILVIGSVLFLQYTTLVVTCYIQDARQGIRPAQRRALLTAIAQSEEDDLTEMDAPNEMLRSSTDSI